MFHILWMDMWANFLRLQCLSFRCSQLNWQPTNSTTTVAVGLNFYKLCIVFSFVRTFNVPEEHNISMGPRSGPPFCQWPCFIVFEHHSSAQLAPSFPVDLRIFPRNQCLLLELDSEKLIGIRIHGKTSIACHKYSSVCKKHERLKIPSWRIGELPS